MTTTPSPPPSTVTGARLGRKQPQNTPEGWTKLTRRESHSSSPAPGRVSGLSALSIMDGPWKPNQRALPKRVGHEIASPKGAAKKEVHTSITGSLDEPSCTANREAQPHPSPRLRYSEWLPTQGQLSCLWCQRLRGRAVNCECLASQFPSPSAGP